LRRGDGKANAGFVETGLAETRVPIFNCPSRLNRIAISGVDVYALPDYAGVMANWNDPGWQGFAWQTSVPPKPNEETLVWTGILVKGGQVNKSSTPPQIWIFPDVDFKSIEDGASNTILVAEKAAPAQFWMIPSTATWPFWEMYGYYTGADWPHMRLFGAMRPDGPNASGLVPLRRDGDSRGASTSPTPEFGFGSAHPEVICSVWGDASTRTISYSADLLVLDQLGKRADQSAVSINDL
jgi:hypothetical protein